MKRIILDFKDIQNRISPEDLEEIRSSIENYLRHDYPKLFEITHEYNDAGEIEIPAIEIESHSYVQFRDIFY